MNIAGYIPVREVQEHFINIQPIQAAGRLTAEAMKALIAYGDGYSTCDQCRKPFRLDKISTHPLRNSTTISLGSSAWMKRVSRQAHAARFKPFV